MPRQPAPKKVFITLEGFTTIYEGVPFTVRAGETIEEGHPFLSLFPDNFRPFVPDFPAPDERRWETATAAPGELR